MEIKEAVEYAREHGLTNITIEDWKNGMKQLFMTEKALECIEVIENALDNCYTLCKVDEAVEKMEKLMQQENEGEMYYYPPYYSERCIKILKEACK